MQATVRTDHKAGLEQRVDSWLALTVENDMGGSCGRLHGWTLAGARILTSIALVAAGCAHLDQEHEGQKSVHSFRIHGASHLDASDLADKLATEQPDWWPFATERWFDPGAFEYDLERVAAYAAAHGYFQARVVNHEVRPHGDQQVDVDLTIDEGLPTRITEVSYQGLPSVLDPDRPALESNLDIKVGDVFDYDRFQASKVQLLSNVQNQGYAYATLSARAEVDRDARHVVITFHVEPGPLVHLSAPSFTGNGVLSAVKLERRLNWTPGDLYAVDTLSVGDSRLYGLGVGSAQSSIPASMPADVPEVYEAPVRIEFTPGKQYELRFGIGLGVEQFRQDARVSGEWMDHNFLGDLRTLRFRIQPAYLIIPDVWKPEQRGPAVNTDIQLVQPDLWETNIIALAAVGFNLDVQPAYQYYGPRGQLGIERDFFHDHVTLGISYNLQYLTFFNLVAGFDPSLTILDNSFRTSYRLAWLEDFIRLDLRDDKIYPRRGLWVELRAEQGEPGIGSNFQYLKLTGDFRFYIPAGSRLVFAGRFELGGLRPNTPNDDPITRRFELGGPNSQRGFSVGRLSPELFDQNKYYPNGIYIPIGGNGAVLGSLDLRVRVVTFGDYWLDYIAFVDAGDVTPDFVQLAAANLNVAVGSSLSYETPIGAVRAGLGVRLNRLNSVVDKNDIERNPDPGSRFAPYITVGEAF